MTNHFDKKKRLDEEMNKFEQDIAIININKYNDKSECYKPYSFKNTTLDIASSKESKEIDSLIQKQRASTIISKIENKRLVSNNKLTNPAHVAIAAAECASSSSKILDKKQRQFFRKAAGKIWYDPTMKQWPNDDFRLFVGNLGREVNVNMLSVPFLQYSSFIKARVVKNRETSMTRGCYGFVSFGNSEDYLRAIKELNGKYVGSRPMRIKKSNWKKRSIS